MQLRQIKEPAGRVCHSFPAVGFVRRHAGRDHPLAVSASFLFVSLATFAGDCGWREADEQTGFRRDNECITSSRTVHNTTP
jgi:hypothetical protein